ncbi:MAG: ATP-binding protein [Planctomycetota bacterium]
MDPITNPFAPGAGSPPPDLTGRDDIRESVRIALERIRIGNAAKSVLIVGLRGVGKTVLLDRIRMEAESRGFFTLRIEAPEERSLPAMLCPQLRQTLLKISRLEAAKDLARQALTALSGFVTALKIRYEDIEVGIDYPPEPGLADNGDLELDLQTLLFLAGRSAAEAGGALVLFIDELQYVKEEELAALIVGLHRAAQDKVPVTLVGAGLPQLRGRMGRAKSYAERLFAFPEIGALSTIDASAALEIPIRHAGADIEKGAVKRIVDITQGYPYFLQEWGKQAWDIAQASIITEADAELATKLAIESLDESFFRVRFDRLTPMEKKYLRAMAELGHGPHRSGDISSIFGKKVSSLAPTRNQLITKGMIWSPNHGDTAFTVPMFDEFMRRVMPGNKWLNE